jgi:GNAT superfamily N-acetyltransferase
MDIALATLRGADAATLNARVDAAQGTLAFLPAEAVEDPGVTHSPGPLPDDFTVLAVDGSHIDVNRHLPLRCSLINIGGCRLTYGAAPNAHMFSKPSLRTSDTDLYLADPASSASRQPVEGALMGLVRAVQEADALADAVEEAGSDLPTLALIDGTLVLWELGGDRYPAYVRSQLMGNGMLAALGRLRTMAQQRTVAAASYISLPNSSEVSNLLRLALCDYDPMGDCQRHCRAFIPGDRHCDAVNEFTDRDLFSRTLAPGERSALFASRSSVVRDSYGDHRVHFFYVNVEEEIGRVEVPAWVADSPELLELTHTLVVDNARRGDGYPVVLQEAHEQAVVTGADREAFAAMVERALEGQRLPVYTSQKQRSKRMRYV